MTGAKTNQADGGAPVLAAAGVTKYFGPTLALQDVSLEAHRGRVVALVGDNGAGKSTLIKILSGVLQPDDGRIYLNGEPTRFHSPADALERGIATVFQDLAVCGLLSITRNLVLGREPLRWFGPFRLLDVRAAENRARAAFRELGVDFERGLHEFAGYLSGGERQALAIARAMHYGSTCLILDEPTAALAVRQTKKVLDHVVAAKEAGQAVIFITHNFPQALSIADDIVVLGRGRVLGMYKRGDIDLDELTEVVASVGDGE